jgi:uncharacterized protein (DUF697 family)
MLQGVEQEHHRTSGMSKRILDGEFDGASAEAKAKAVQDVIRQSSLETATLTLEPVPLLDVAIFTPIQHRMVQAVGRLRGYRLDIKAVQGTCAITRGHLVAPDTAIVLAKFILFVPILPDLIAGAVAAAVTSAIGELSDRYFRGGRTMSAVEMKASFDPLFWDQFRLNYRERRDELKALFRSSHVRRELHELRRARHNGTMGADEVAQRTTEILDRHEHGHACRH